MDLARMFPKRRGGGVGGGDREGAVGLIYYFVIRGGALKYATSFPIHRHSSSSLNCFLAQNFVCLGNETKQVNMAQIEND